MSSKPKKPLNIKRQFMDNSENLSLQAALAEARAFLKKNGVENPFLDAEVLLAHVVCLDRTGLYRQSEQELKPAQLNLYWQLVQRRAKKEPVAYLTGKKEFMGLEFEVGPAVLIPRPQTELLVERACVRVKEFVSSSIGSDGKTSVLVADVGTGCGAIAVSLAKYLPDARIYATDCSPEALFFARINADKHGVGEKIIFFKGDLLSPLLSLGLAGKINLITANLPYIPTDELENLMPDVRLYEPRQALDGGPDGLFHYRRLFFQAFPLLSRPGYLLVEIGGGQGPLIRRFFNRRGLFCRLIDKTMVEAIKT